MTPDEKNKIEARIREREKQLGYDELEELDAEHAVRGCGCNACRQQLKEAEKDVRKTKNELATLRAKLEKE